MKWIKKGLIYSVENIDEWRFSHCHKPTPLIIDDDTIRIFFGVRDKDNHTRTTFIDLDVHNISKVKYIHDKPVLDLGKIGTFDDSGANVSAIVKNNDLIYMYYFGWNPSTTVHTRNSIGIAVSRDSGVTFERLFDGPILDRNRFEPYYTGAVDVIQENGKWKMWYTSGTQWKIIKQKPEICYHIKYAESENGIDWYRPDISCILPQDEFEATARPSVIKEDDIYKMWYSRRFIDNFRTDKNKNYRAGYAESKDGINWKRLDDFAGIDISSEGWDSEAIAYPYVTKHHEKLIMFYNGNGFGKTGFGYAEKCYSGVVR